jgi:hypothetical protein
MRAARFALIRGGFAKIRTDSRMRADARGCARMRADARAMRADARIPHIRIRTDSR